MDYVESSLSTVPDLANTEIIARYSLQLQLFFTFISRNEG